MKEFVLIFGERLLRIFILLGSAFAVFVFLFGLSAGGGEEIFYGFLIAIGIFFGVISLTFLLYLLIDIRDKNIETNDLLRKLVDK